MSSGFVSEGELAEARRRRQEEWEQVRAPDQPLEAPEEVYDSRPLFQRLEEQKQKKDAEYEETHKLKNMIRGLDDDEVGFLDLVERSKDAAARQISLEEQREMREFRERVSSLQETAENKRLAQQLAEPAIKKTTTNVNSTRSKLQGVIVRKRKLSDVEPSENGLLKNGLTKGDAGKTAKLDEKKGQVEIKTQVNGGAEVASSGMKCIAVLPGLGHYNDETSDSDNSSDTDDCAPQMTAFDLCGRRQEKKKEDTNKS